MTPDPIDDAASPLTQTWLIDTSTNQPAKAELWSPLVEAHLADWEAEWMPELFSQLRALNSAGADRKHWPQNRHWNWRNKIRAIERSLSNPSFAIVCAGVTQAMMITDLRRRGRIKSQNAEHLVYIDYLETAPWNRPGLTQKQARFKGAGSVLIGTAIKLSVEEGFKGRIGLHSLPQANSFYSNTCGMTDLGQDSNYENLRYFEMTPEQAEAFIASGEST